MTIEGEISLGIRVPQMPLVELAWQRYLINKALRPYRSLVTPVECRLYDGQDLQAIPDYKAAIQSGARPVWRLPSRGFLRFAMESAFPLSPGVKLAERPPQPTASAITFQ